MCIQKTPLEGQVSDHLFSTHGQFCRTNIFYPLILTRRCAYQGVKILVIRINLCTYKMDGPQWKDSKNNFINIFWGPDSEISFFKWVIIIKIRSNPTKRSKNRSSRQTCYIKISVLKNFAQENTCEFCKFFKNNFFTGHFETTASKKCN